MHLWIALLGLAFGQETTETTEEVETTEEAAPVMPASGRVDFDDQVIKGSVASGAVYLLKRQPRALPALVPVRISYRDRIVHPVLGVQAKPEPEPQPESTPEPEIETVETVDE